MSSAKSIILSAIGGGLLSAMLASTAYAADALSCGLNNGQVATGEPILVGSIVGRTGPDDFSAAAYSAKAYFDCVNQNGGINGRPIQYLIEDDQWSPELSSQLAKKLVVDGKVVAMIGNSSFVDCTANAEIYRQNGLISVSGVGVTRECFESVSIAPLEPGPKNSGIGILRYATQNLNSKVVACIMPNTPSLGDWTCEGAIAWGKENGVEVRSYLVDPGTVDPTSVLLQVIAEKPDTILIGVPKNVALQFTTVAEQQDLAATIKFIGLAGLYSHDMPAAIGPYWDRRFYVNMSFNDLNSTAADNQNWRAVMDAHASPSVSRDTFAQAGYLAARVAVEAMLKLDPSNITRETVNAALAEVKDFKSDILCQDWYFDKEATGHAANQGGPTALAVDGKWETIGGCPVLN